MIRTALFVAVTLAAVQAQAEEKPLRVYFVGNSVTDTINYRALAELAKSRGHTHVWGRHMIPGAPLQWIWQHPKDGFQEPPFGHYPNALANFQWDVLSLQPFDRHLDGKDGDIIMARNFIDLALPKSPDLQVFVYARWPRQQKDDFDTAWLKKYTGGWDGTNETKDYFERLTRELRKAYPKLKIRMVPVGHVMYELNQRMKAGEVPGYQHIKEVFADGIHLNNVGSYVVGCTYFATLYKENPKGLPGEPYKVTDPKLAAVIQETVWKVVSTNELAGVLPSRKSGDQTRTLQVDGRTRSYIIHVPPKLDPKKPMPVVLAFHGAATNASIMAISTGLSEKADEAGFVVVYPNGTGKGDILLVWNAGGWHGPKAEKEVDDVKFVREVLDDLPKVVNVDPKRVYATGISNGGMMCYRLAAEMSNRIAAIAPVSGTLAVEKCHPDRPVPVMHFHGTDDKLVPFNGPDQQAAKVFAFKSVEETIRIWVKIDGCPMTPTTTKLPHKGDDGTTVERKTYGPGKNGAEVILFVINGGGHTWPGRKWPMPWLGKTTHDISANDLIWEFFKRHPMTDAEKSSKHTETTTKETEAPTFDIKTRKVEDRVTATVEKDTAIFDATSRSGIGGATVTLAKGKWPTTVVLRLHLSGMEQLTIFNGTIKLTGSVLSHSGNPRLLDVVEDGKEKKVEKDSPYWTEIRGLDSTGKPVPGLPGSGGYFEITVPKALLDGQTKTLELGWIDFYRK